MHLSKATFEVLCSGRSKTSQLCLSGPHPILCSQSQRRQVAAEKILSWLAGVVKHQIGPGHEISGRDRKIHSVRRGRNLEPLNFTGLGFGLPVLGTEQFPSLLDRAPTHFQPIHSLAPSGGRTCLLFTSRSRSS